MYHFVLLQCGPVSAHVKEFSTLLADPRDLVLIV